MFGFIKGLFATNSDDVMTVATGVGNWIDKQQFTDEEKSTAHMKALEHQLKWINATQGMNLARRYLALMFCLTFLLSFVICLISAVIGVWLDMDIKLLTGPVIELVTTFKIDWLTGLIVVFYFGKGIAENIRK